MKKILIADSLDQEALEKIESIPDFEVTLKTGMDEDELVKTIPDFNATVVRGATKMTKKVIDAASNLELIIRAGIGLDNIDLAAAREKGVEVANTPAATSISVAEHTFGLMLAAVRNHGQANLSMKEHRWEKKKLSGTELYGKMLGVIGIGRIGQEVAKRALAFGMKVIAYDVIDIETELDVKKVGFEELISQADVITLHLPLTDKTKHMISDREFEKMKDGVILVNASRGGTVDEGALLRALEAGKIRAAALDVFEKEPPEDFTLVNHPSVIATPHIGAAAKEGQKRAGMEVVSILRERLS
jgi:D-3-phosphoglycerate dehydrogenase